MPCLQEIRGLSLHLHKRAGKGGRKIAGHANQEMTRNYHTDHSDAL